MASVSARLTTRGPAAPDLVVFADRVVTLRGGIADADTAAIGITSGRISHLGTRLEGQSWDAACVTDFPGSVITPGLVDAHIHPIHGQNTARGVFLGDAQTPRQAAELLASAAEEEGGWVLGWGLTQSVFGEEAPSSQFLEEVLPGRLVVATFFDGHALLASRAVLSEAGIHGGKKFPGGGKIVCDSDGVPTGLFLEHAAMALVRACVPPLSFAQKVERVRETLEGMAAVGLTGGEMLDFEDPDSLRILDEIEASGDLAIRLRIAPWVLSKHGDDQLDRIIRLQGRHGRRWAVRGAKLMIDGTIDNGTAWLYEPDVEGAGGSSLYAEPARYVAALRRLDARGISTTTHAIGDRGIRFVIDAIADLPEGGPRHRIEHIEEITDAGIEALAESGATASMQPTHCTHFLHADRSDTWSRRLGDNRVDLAFRARDVRDAVGLLALGSDWPIAPYDPREIMADAQTRRRTATPHSAPVSVDQGLSGLEALRGYTCDVADSTGVPGGRIDLGLLADFTVFAGDPTTVSPEVLMGLPVRATFLAGELAGGGVEIAEVPAAT